MTGKKLSDPEPNQIEVFLPAAGRIPSPAAIALYAKTDPSLPEFFKQTVVTELARNYTFQKIAFIGGTIFLSFLVVAFCYLTVHGEKYAGGAILGINFLSVVTQIFTRGARR